jgi:N utilization substance protein A
VDPVGACVGMKGSRVQAVVQELRGEKIDIVPYDSDPAKFVCNAIAPAEVARVLIDAGSHTMELIVPDDKLSLAIGKKGQNVRLASQLTGWRIDIHSESKVKELEEQAIRSMAEISGSSEDLAHTLFKLGWRSAMDVANGKVEELGGVPGVGGEAGAQRLKEAAAKQVELEKTRRAEESRRAAEAAALAASMTDEQKLLAVRGVGENTLPELYRGGYTTVEKLYGESDLQKLAESTGVGLKKAQQLKHWAGVYLGKIDPATPAPSEEAEQQ